MRIISLSCCIGLALIAVSSCSGGEEEVGRACGNGVVDPGEVCDQGSRNSNSLPDTCRLDCRPPRCGDRVLDYGEECDDGQENSDATPGACRTTCTPASCGDGVRDQSEACDDGTGNSDGLPDACRTTCASPRCGDGVTDSGEQCDDGNDVDTDACSNACAPNTSMPIVLSAAAARLDADRVRLVVHGTDGGGDATGLSVVFLSASGAELDLDGDSLPDTVELELSPSVSGQTEFDGVAEKSGMTGVAAVKARLRVVDAGGRRSTAVEAGVFAFAVLAAGQLCDSRGLLNICEPGLYCAGTPPAPGTCQPVPGSTCAAPIDLNVAAGVAGGTYTFTGSTAGGPANETGSCQPGAVTSGSETVHVITLGMRAELIIATDHPTTAFDTVLYARSVCSEPASELACNDDAGGAGIPGASELLLAEVPAHTPVYIIVDGRDAAASGAYELSVDVTALRGYADSCGPAERCGPGLECDAPTGSCVPLVPLVINEVLYDGVGADLPQVFTELFGPAGLDLGGFTLVGLNGNDVDGDPVYRTVALSGVIPADGFFVVAHSDAHVDLAAVRDCTGNVDWQNGPIAAGEHGDAVLLRDPAGNVVDALMYGDVGEPPNPAVTAEGDPAAAVPAGSSLSRDAAHTDSGNNAADFTESDPPTPGT